MTKNDSYHLLENTYYFYLCVLKLFLDFLNNCEMGQIRIRSLPLGSASPQREKRIDSPVHLLYSPIAFRPLAALVPEPQGYLRFIQFSKRARNGNVIPLFYLTPKFPSLLGISPSRGFPLDLPRPQSYPIGKPLSLHKDEP